MEFLKNIGRAVSEAASYLGEKNRRAAQLSRIRTVIRCQEKAAEKEYLALGRFYYNNLRDKDNPVTEPHCANLDHLEEGLDRALKQLEKFYTNPQSDREEISLDDVTAYDQDSIVEGEPETVTEETSEAQEAPQAPAEKPVEEIENLPFEG